MERYETMGWDMQLIPPTRRTEDIVKGVFVPVSAMPKAEPKKAERQTA